MHIAFEAQQDFPRILAATLATTQLEFDPLSSVDIVRGSMPGVALQSPDGATDIFVNDLQRWSEKSSPLETPVTQEPYTLRDLVPYKVGRVAIRIDTSDAGIRLYSVKVETAPSPQGFNSAQTILGRTPGKDAIKVVRTALRRHLVAGDWIDSHTRMEHLVAGVTSGFATHDMNPLEHLQSLYATAPELCQAFQQTAIGLTSRFGDRVHDPDNKPREARDFMGGVDDWQIYTRTLVSIMHTMSESMEQSSDNQLAILEEIVADKGQTVHAHIFRRIGLIAVDASSSEILATTRSITAATFKNLASMYGHLEDVRPIPDLTARQKSHRKKTWETISTSLTPLETPIRSIYA